MNDASAADDAKEEGLEIQAERRSAAIGAAEAAEDQQRIAVRESSVAARTGAEYAEAEAWAYDDPSTSAGPRR